MENKKEKYPFVSIIFPNWNGKDDTLECLDSLGKLNYPKERMEIIIVDNGSVDGSQKAIEEKFKKMRKDGWWRLKLIKNNTNIGAPAAYNQGIKEANPNYDYIWKLDNDIELDSDSLIELVKVAITDKNIAAVGGKVYLYSEPNVIQQIGSILSPLSSCSIGRLEVDNGQYDKCQLVDAPNGCMLLVKKQAIEDIGLMDERFFLFRDDFDWLLRMKNKGYINLYVYRAKCWHKTERVLKQLTPQRIYYENRNRIYLVKKNFPFFIFLLFLLKYFFYTLPKIIGGLFIKRKQPDLILPLVKGIIEGINMKSKQLVCK